MSGLGLQKEGSPLVISKKVVQTDSTSTAYKGVKELQREKELKEHAEKYQKQLAEKNKASSSGKLQQSTAFTQQQQPDQTASTTSVSKHTTGTGGGVVGAGGVSPAGMPGGIYC